MKLQSIQNLVSVFPDAMTEMEDKAEVVCECDINKVIEVVKQVINAGQDEYYANFTLTIEIQSIQESISLSFSDNLNTIHVDELSELSQQTINQEVEEASLKALLSVLEDKTRLSPGSWIEQLQKDSRKLARKDIMYRIVLILPKRPLTDFLTHEFDFRESGIDCLIFFSTSGFMDYMTGQGCLSILHKISSGSGVILCIGGMKGELINRYLAIVNLWQFREIFQRQQAKFNDLSKIPTNEIFTSRSVSFQSRPFIGIPDALNFGDEISSVDALQRDIFDSLQILTSILLISTSATSNNDWNQWCVHIVGSKTIDGQVSYEKGVVYVDGIDISEYHDSFLEFYQWSFDSQDTAKLWIARKTMALQASSLLDCLKNINSIHNSAVGAFHLYLDQTTSEILKAKQNFTESLQGWVEKDVDLRLKLKRVLYESLYGGFGAIILSVLGVISQSNNQFAINLIILLAPILFILYLLLALIRSESLCRIFEDYLKQHMNQIRYYKSVLGESVILDLTDSIEEQTLREEFTSARKKNRLVIIFFSIASLAIWVLFLRFLIVPT